MREIAPRWRVAIVLSLVALTSGALIAAFMLIASWLESDVDVRAGQFLQALKEGRHLAAEEYLSTNMRQLSLLMGGVTDKSLKPCYRKGKMANYSLILTERTENAARYKITVTCTDGKKYDDLSLDMRMEDGKWRVARF